MKDTIQTTPPELSKPALRIALTLLAICWSVAIVVLLSSAFDANARDAVAQGQAIAVAAHHDAGRAAAITRSVP